MLLAKKTHDDEEPDSRSVREYSPLSAIVSMLLLLSCTTPPAKNYSCFYLLFSRPHVWNSPYSLLVTAPSTLAGQFSFISRSKSIWTSFASYVQYLRFCSSCASVAPQRGPLKALLSPAHRTLPCSARSCWQSRSSPVLSFSEARFRPRELKGLPMVGLCGMKFQWQANLHPLQ